MALPAVSHSFPQLSPATFSLLLLAGAELFAKFIVAFVGARERLLIGTTWR